MNNTKITKAEYDDLVETAKCYDSGDIDIWADENCPDEIYPIDMDLIKEIWLKAHKEDKDYL